MLRTKRKYKDSLFVDLFARCDEAEENFLSLFNALHGSSFKKGEIPVKPLELDNIIYTGLSNDLSMLVGSSLVVLVEHQSTINENMPLRFLEYLAKLYEKILPERSRYLKKAIELPVPEFFVLYNGEASYPQEKTLRFSDSLQKNLSDSGLAQSPLEISVKVYNINYREDNSLLKSCKTLKV